MAAAPRRQQRINRSVFAVRFTRIASRKLQFSSHLAPAILLHHAGAKGRIPSPKIWVWPDRSLTKECEWSPGGADRGAATLFAWPPR